MPSRRKPVAKCRFLFKPATTRGWGTIESPESPNHDDSGWTPDPTFQAVSTGTVKQPVVPPRQPTIRPPRAIRQSFPSRCQRTPSDRCVLVVWTLEHLEYITQQECSAIWPNARSTFVGPGKVEVTLSDGEEISRALELRSALGLHLVVKRQNNYFSGTSSMESLKGKLRHEAQWIPWYHFLRTWAILTADERSFDPYVDLEYWFPPPSFHVICVTPKGEEILNYDEISKAFTHGFQAAFKSWDPNPTSPDLVVILEIKDGTDLTVLLEMQPCCMLQSPLVEPSSAIQHIAVAHAVLTVATIEPGDILVNCACSMLDIADAVMLHDTHHGHITVCDANPSIVEASVKRAGRWSEEQKADGVICSMEHLPFTDSSVDVVIGFLHDSQNHAARQNLSRQLQQMARICRLSTGRVCFLTNQGDVIDSILVHGAAWSSQKKISMRFRSFDATLYLLKRSANPLMSTTAASDASRFWDRSTNRHFSYRFSHLSGQYAGRRRSPPSLQWQFCMSQDQHSGPVSEHHDEHDDDMEWEGVI